LPIAAALAVTPAWAAGGADVVDDAFVETPGDCHIESWLTGASYNGSLAHLGVGCTPRAVPRLELDGAVEHPIGQSGGATFFPAAKYTLLARPAALSLGISATGQIDRRGHAVRAAVNLPLSLSRGRYTEINLNLGWQWLDHKLGLRDGVTWGAQVDQAVVRHTRLIGEIFGTGVHPGTQGGLRWSPGHERIDVDLRFAHDLDGPRHAVILGVTIRL
jgi:hypothetical protein